MEKPTKPTGAEVTVPETSEHLRLDIGPGVTFYVPERQNVRFSFPEGAGLGSLVIDLRLAGGRYVIERLEASGPEGGQVDLEALRRFPFRERLRRMLPAMLGRGAGTAEALASVFSTSGAESLERVAVVYRFAELLGDPPTSAVARDLHISQPAAAQRVRRARAAGLLPPAKTSGKAASNAPK